MNEEEFHRLDFYRKLEKINYIMRTILNKLDAITSTAAAQGFEFFEEINELLETLEKAVLLFDSDEELNQSKNWRSGYIFILKKDVLNVIPLIKSREVGPEALIEILLDWGKELEANCPSNISLAQTFRKLLEFKTEIASELGIDEILYQKVIGKIALNSDRVDNYLKMEMNETLKKSKKGL